MLDLADAGRQFQYFNDQVINAYEEELKRRRRQREHIAALRKRRREEEREILASLLDRERLDRLVQENEAASLDFLREVRPSFVQRPSLRAEEVKRHALFSGLQLPNRKTVPVYAATLLADDAASLEGNPGEHGNPWVLPENPGRIRIRAVDQGTGWSCEASGYDPTKTNAIAVVWFVFIPDTTAKWDLLAVIDFHGFYLAVADDSWWNCDNSSVRVEVIMDVYQYYWHGDKLFTLLNIDEGNIAVASSLDDTPRLEYFADLRAGDMAWVKVTLNLHVSARGGGSISEVDFASGVANYIEPVVLIAFY